jgi:tripartite-type tricarboxylate transporter receptor subunit TctC
MKQLAILVYLLVATLGARAADPYPTRPVRLVVPYSPGNATDASARILAAYLTKSFNQQFLVDNRAGASGQIGVAAVSRAVPDGYMLLVGTSATQAMNPHMFKSAADTGKDLDPVILTVKVPLLVSTAPDFPATSLQEILAEARKRPGGLSVAYAGTANQLLYEYLKQRSGAPLVGVPYKGSPEALNDVIGGQVSVIVDGVTASRPQAAAGKIRPVAITTLRPSDLMPGLRTVSEQGFPGFELTAWNAIFAPKGTPRAVIDLLNLRIAAALADRDVREQLLSAGLAAETGASPESLAEFLRAEHRKWGELVRASGIPMQ